MDSQDEVVGFGRGELGKVSYEMWKGLEDEFLDVVVGFGAEQERESGELGGLIHHDSLPSECVVESVGEDCLEVLADGFDGGLFVLLSIPFLGGESQHSDDDLVETALVVGSLDLGGDLREDEGEFIEGFNEGVEFPERGCLDELEDVFEDIVGEVEDLNGR